MMRQTSTLTVTIVFLCSLFECPVVTGVIKHARLHRVLAVFAVRRDDSGRLLQQRPLLIGHVTPVATQDDASPHSSQQTSPGSGHRSVRAVFFAIAQLHYSQFLLFLCFCFPSSLIKVRLSIASRRVSDLDG
ncbi:hypothetical protein BC834DRAFT_910563 [Gloeopeniophorella convolvens]|nr:hypothetical protein BC834DRAFT_919310 [Gloeopeniophorella convolvens]KAI0258642.1 hypothetical protein BC834DRAFT_910563 [Gloeopeniophorella convolvens]